VTRLQALGAQAIGEAADVRDPEATSAVLQHAHAAFGDIDVLVSGAAGNFPAAALDMSPNAFGSVVNIDLLGVFPRTEGRVPAPAQARCGHLNVSAPQAFLPMALQSHVCAAKAGVDMLTRVLAIEWGDAGILAPTQEAREIVRATVPAARSGTPKDVADVFLFLASPPAAYVTGVVLAADGGWSLGGAVTAMTAIADRLAKAKADGGDTAEPKDKRLTGRCLGRADACTATPTATPARWVRFSGRNSAVVTNIGQADHRFGGRPTRRKHSALICA
jgi:NAD(P)-dependent dehydrogenase (short-subunit alcohol dehydrogenase family)